ncbi:hypothetical protein Mal64_24590 [Pseudobythopirellula maris]|uniref:Thiol-disulfide oxidoreductase n=1 Tax=Pseudobythopirellula maris TaxID=2527991 RepID=A0A5C5ZP63_9BACT|nr:DUF393 domain-containing protein [Pseudobythopirellula maris]TWT88968.1 hypothetical protein Mal64_24590 [Pseudobythopirellula maris]
MTSDAKTNASDNAAQPQDPPQAAQPPPQAGSELPGPDERPDAAVVLYDGQCVFCRRQAERLAWWDCQGKLAYLSLHDPLVEECFPDISRERLLDEMCLVDQSGERHWGADAFKQLTVRLRRLWWLAPVMWLPGMMLLARPVYRWVSRNRYMIAGKRDECADGACSLHK